MTHELVLTQHVPAPPTAVYAAWLSPEGMSRWWWVSIGDTTYAVDGRVGGDYLIESAGAGIGVRGTFTALVEPTTIELTWTWLDGGVPGPEEHVRVDLSEQGGGTLVTVTHRVAESEGVGPYREGWTHVLGNLARLHGDDGVLQSEGNSLHDRGTLPGDDTLQSDDAPPDPDGAQPGPDGAQPAITLTQVVPAPRTATYAAWLDPDRLATWWWPGTDTTYEIDARPGGRFAIRSAQTGLGARGTLTELVDGERIVMTWTRESPGPPEPPGPPPAEDRVTVTFTDHEGSPGITLITLVHEFAVPQADTSNPTHGWTAVLASLAEHTQD